tara:strand:- start:663 stop:929 length:267 start_codon:yes stop_codon:yes gene_type:complete
MTEQIETLWDKIQSLEERIELLEKSNGSKRSDEISKVAENTSFDNLPKVQNKDSFGEISDEEIEEQSWGNEDWSNGAKWYREKLKQRQ